MNNVPLPSGSGWGIPVASGSGSWSAQAGTCRYPQRQDEAARQEAWAPFVLIDGQLRMPWTMEHAPPPPPPAVSREMFPYGLFDARAPDMRPRNPAPAPAPAPDPQLRWPQDPIPHNLEAWLDKPGAAANATPFLPPFSSAPSSRAESTTDFEQPQHAGCQFCPADMDIFAACLEPDPWAVSDPWSVLFPAPDIPHDAFLATAHDPLQTLSLPFHSSNIAY